MRTFIPIKKHLILEMKMVYGNGDIEEIVTETQEERT